MKLLKWWLGILVLMLTFAGNIHAQTNAVIYIYRPEIKDAKNPDVTLKLNGKSLGILRPSRLIAVKVLDTAYTISIAESGIEKAIPVEYNLDARKNAKYFLVADYSDKKTFGDKTGHSILADSIKIIEASKNPQVLQFFIEETNNGVFQTAKSHESMELESMKSPIKGLKINRQSNVTWTKNDSGDFATIYIFRTKKYGSGFDLNVSMNHRDICKIGSNTLVEYRIYSQGRIQLDLDYYPGSLNGEQLFEVIHGKTYFANVVLIPGLKPKVILTLESTPDIEAMNAREFFKSYEEDITQPIANNIVGGKEVNDESASKTGSGFLISPLGYIVTNYHVVGTSKKINIRGINGDFNKSYPARIVVSDKNNDLAIIKLNEEVKLDSIPYVLKGKVADLGENVYALGYPLLKSMGEDIKLTNGILSSKNGYQGDVTSYQVSVPVQPGNSGGPLYDNNGNLIGIINAKIFGADNASYAVKAKYLNLLLEDMDTPLKFTYKGKLAGKTLSEQVKEIQKFVYIIEVNKD